MPTSWVDFTNSFLRHCTDRHCLVYFWNQIRNKSWTKATLLRIYFRNLSVHRSFLQNKSQCLEKVIVKYVIKRLWHEIFHMIPGINPRPISALQLRCWAWYGCLWLIPGPIWKMSCNNLFVLIKKYTKKKKRYWTDAHETK